MQQTDDMKRLWDQVNDVKTKFEEIVSLSKKRVALSASIRDDEKKKGINPSNLIEFLRSDISELHESKKKFIEKVQTAKSIDNFKKEVLKLVRKQKKYLDCIKEETSLFHGIISNAKQISDDLSSLVGELKELITYFSIVTDRQDDSRKKRIGKQLLSRIIDFSDKLQKLKTLNDELFKIKIDVGPEEMNVYLMDILDEEKIRNSKDITSLAEHILSILMRERSVLEAIIVFDTAKSQLESIVNDMDSFSHEVKTHQAHRIALTFGRKRTAATIILALSELFSLAFGQDVPQNQSFVPQSPPGIYASYDSSSVANQTNPDQLSMASSKRATLQQKYAFLDINRRDPIEKNILAKINVDLCNKYPKFKDLDLTGMLAAALFDLKYHNDGEGLKVVDAIDDIGNSYGTNDRAEFNFEMGKFIIDDLRKPLPDLPHIDGATPLQPKQWLENGFLLLPIKWTAEGIETILPKTKVTDASQRSLAHFALSAMINGKYGLQAIEYLDQKKIRNLGYISITLGDACKKGGHFQDAYILYYISLEKTKRQDTYEKMVECAKTFSNSLLIQAAYGFVNDFSPGSSDVKSIPEGTASITRGLKDAIKTGVYFVHDANWRWKDGNIIPKRINNSPVDNVTQEQLLKYFSKLKYMAGLASTHEEGCKLLLDACNKYWNNTAFVKMLLPTIRGPPYDIWAATFEKAIHDERFQQDKTYFRDLTRILGTYYEENNKKDDWNSLVAYYNSVKK